LFTTSKIARVSVINDLVTDGRVKKTCQTLVECGYEVVLIGRELPGSLPLPNWPYRAERMKLFFKKGPFFYFFFNLRLLFRLLSSKSDLLVANDLDTLLPNYLASKWKKIPLVYDSHELFCEVPELQHSHLKRGIWQQLEKTIVPNLKHCITVNDSIAKIFKDRYQVSFAVVRNIPEWNSPKFRSRLELGLPEDKKIVILQGAGINIQRGAEEVVEAMQWVEGALLLIIGGGDVWPELHKRVDRFGLRDKVQLIDKLPKEQLVAYTMVSDLGLSLDKNTNLNYYYSLPNKLFDYLFAGVPVLASRLPELEKIISTYVVGDFIENHEVKHIAAKLNELLHDPKLQQYKTNTRNVQQAYNWPLEKLRLIAVIQQAEQERQANARD